ncbi:hypothetical protein [Glycomyces tarimensis]
MSGQYAPNDLLTESVSEHGSKIHVSLACSTSPIRRLMPPSVSARMNGRMLGAAARNLSERERLAAA